MRNMAPFDFDNSDVFDLIDYLEARLAFFIDQDAPTIVASIQRRLADIRLVWIVIDNAPFDEIWG